MCQNGRSQGAENSGKFHTSSPRSCCGSLQEVVAHKRFKLLCSHLMVEVLTSILVECSLLE